jgi:hypothetical protein
MLRASFFKDMMLYCGGGCPMFPTQRRGIFARVECPVVTFIWISTYLYKL